MNDILLICNNRCKFKKKRYVCRCEVKILFCNKIMCRIYLIDIVNYILCGF